MAGDGASILSATAFEDYPSPANSASVIPDGRAVATAGAENTIPLRDIGGQPVGRPLTGHVGPVLSVAVGRVWDRDDVVSGGEDNTIRLWDIGGQPIGRPVTGHVGPVLSVAVGRFGDRGVVVSAGKDSTVRLWDAGGQPIGRPVTGHVGPVLSVAVGRFGDRDVVISGGDDNTVRLWDIGGHLIGGPLTGHTSRVNAVAIGRLGEREVIASASSDHTIRLWDATGHLIGGPLTGHTGGVNAVAVSPGGDTIVAAGDDGILWLYDALSDWPVEETDDLLKSTPTVIASVTSDDASEEDLLGVTPEVERLSALICARATSAPLSVALLGDWGSGKSSFMLQMKRRVARLAEASRDSSPDNAFVGNVRQAWFNAWHYSDDTVWVGMVEQLFRALAIDPHASDPDPDSERPHQIRKRLTDIRAERSKIEADLSARQSTNSKIGPKVRSYANQAFRSLKKHWFGLGILPTILILAGLALWQGFGKDLTGWTITATVGAWVSALLVRAARAFRRTKEALEAADEKMRDRDNNLASEEQNLQEALVKADAIVGLTRFVNQGVGDDITKYRGIVAEVHQQLQELDRRITNAGRQLPELLGGERPIERVILYVDDLDRCPPQKVVDVLAAVDLLLSLPLFVGVVGVDARWLRRSLQHHEQTLFPEAEHAGDLPLEEVRDPLDYLDKIFQIPYSLRKPRPETVREYVGTLLLPRSGQETGLAEDTVPAPAPSEVLADTQDPVDDPPATSARSPGHGSESTKEAQRARTVASRASERSPINLRPENLTISSHEIDYLGSVGAHLLSTPRAAKKLVNLYRLVRCGVSPAELSTFADSSDAEPYRATALLLGVLVGCPRLAARVFPEIGSANPDLDLSTLIRATVHGGVGKTEHSLAHDALSDCPMCIAALQLDTALGSMRPLPGYPTKVGAYKRWALEVSHLSFHTAPLLQRRRAVRGPLGLELR